MALLVHDCPHCLTTRCGMICFGANAYPLEQGKRVGTDDYGDPLFMWPIAIAAICQVCARPICAVVNTPFANPIGNYRKISAECVEALLGKGDVRSLGYEIENVWPQAQPPSIPAHLPNTVEKAFRSAENNYLSPDNEDAAAMLYRRSIDIAIREKHPEVTGLLAPRISKLAELGLLPPSMKEWADQIRLIGNDGAHEPEGVTREDLTPMRGFTEAFLRYFITLPFEVAQRRGEIDHDGNLINNAAT